MAGFALFSLPPILLEKVITKIDAKGYFRLQQTCHSVGEFIRQCGNISVRLFGYDYYAQIDKSQVYSLRLKHEASIHLDWLYGIKMPIFRFYHTPMVSAQEFITLMDDHFVPFCDSLRTNRITCQELWFFGDGWTAEHCATLLTVLKPGQVYISSDRSDRYKALFHRKGLKHAHLSLGSAGAAIKATTELLPTIPKLRIEVFHFKEGNNLLITVLQILRSQPTANLSFSSWKRLSTLPSKEELEEQFSDFNPRAAKQRGRAEMLVELDAPPGYYCRLTITCNVVHLLYTLGRKPFN